MEDGTFCETDIMMIDLGLSLPHPSADGQLVFITLPS